MKVFSRLMIKGLISIFFISQLMACSSSIWFPFMYRPYVHQGNTISQTKVDQLRAGMNERQVKYLMGQPVLQDPFNPDRWDYLNWLKDGDENEVYQNRLTLFFEEGKLVSAEGDFATQLHAAVDVEFQTDDTESNIDPDIQ